MEDRLLIALSAVIIAGSAIEEIYHTDFTVRHKEKDDPITEADLQAHRTIANVLKAFFPQDVLLSEEDIPPLDQRLGEDAIWILDPLDGTRDFVAKNPEFAISLGYVEQNRAKIGIIYNPVTYELFWGEKAGLVGSIVLKRDEKSGLVEKLKSCLEFLPEIQNSINRYQYQEPLETSKHSYSEEDAIHGKKQIISFVQEYILAQQEPIESNSQSTQKPVRILISQTEARANLFSEFQKITDFNNSYSFIPMGSIAYKLGVLSQGGAEMVVSLKPKNEWDICGGIAILNSIGFQTLEIKTGKPHRFNQKDTLTYGLVSGKKELVEEFWQENRELLQKSLRKWDGSSI